MIWEELSLILQTAHAMLWHHGIDRLPVEQLEPGEREREIEEGEFVISLHIYILMHVAYSTSNPADL